MRAISPGRLAWVPRSSHSRPREQVLLRSIGFVALAALFLVVSWAEPVLGVLVFLIVTNFAVLNLDR